MAELYILHFAVHNLYGQLRIDLRHALKIAYL